MYEAFYGLSADPFRLNPDPRFYFKSPGHQKAMAYLTYGLEKAEGFVVITGDTGTGKTTLAQRLLKDLDDQSHITATLTNTQLDPLEALQSIAQEFGLSDDLDTKPKIIERLRRFFEAREKESERALLIVDEAQNLPAKTLEELRMLTNLQSGGHSLIQIIFLAQPQFSEMIDKPEFSQFRERVGAAVDLDRLRRSDIKGYVEHRLSVADWTGNPQVTDAAYDLIFETTSGLPRRINKFLARCLLAAFLDERNEIDTSLVSQVKAELREDPSWKEDVAPVTARDDGSQAPPIEMGVEGRISELESEVKSIEKMLHQLLDLLVKRQQRN